MCYNTKPFVYLVHLNAELHCGIELLVIDYRIIFKKSVLIGGFVSAMFGKVHVLICDMSVEILRSSNFL